MGVYKKDTLNNDFKIASKNLSIPINFELEAIAEMILKDAPDNRARDMAISNLLTAAEMIVYAYAFGTEHDVKWTKVVE